MDKIKRRNLIHKKLKNRDPNETVNVSLAAPAYLLSDAKQFGDVAHLVRESLKRTHKDKFLFDLREQLGTLSKNIELLQQWRDNGAIYDEGEIDEYHLQLLEVYKHIYLSLKKSRMLRRRSNHQSPKN